MSRPSRLGSANAEVVRQTKSLPNESFWWFKTLHEYAVGTGKQNIWRNEACLQRTKQDSSNSLKQVTKTDVTEWQGPTTVGCSQDGREYQPLVRRFTYNSCEHSSHFGKLIRMLGAVGCRQEGGRKLEVAVDGLKREKWQKWMDIGDVVCKGSSWGIW